VLLHGKGGDIIEFRDKRTDIDVLWSSPHDWAAPSDAYPPSDSDSAWQAHYPGGWQQNLPLAGWGGSVSGVSYGTHGESALVPWDATVVADTDDRVVLELSTELVRYPLALTRRVELEADSAVVRFEDEVVNEGAVPLEYIWQQHIALGPPLISPRSRLYLPPSVGHVEPSYPDNGGFEHARLQADKSFEWPMAPTADGETLDLREFPLYDATVHDQVYLTDFDDGWYAVSNPDLDLGFSLNFPESTFECLWYWQAFGGMTGSPFFGQNYNVGIEPTTAYPAGSIPEAQRENDTIDTLAPGERVRTRLTAVTYDPEGSVSEVAEEGDVKFEGA